MNAPLERSQSRVFYTTILVPISPYGLAKRRRPVICTNDLHDIIKINWIECWLIEMAQIRGTIDLFTKILRENGASRIKSEVFRQAKFNQEDAVCFLFWLQG